mmetsp:Transcript_18070/g.22958  ORF Transcript_18070/g.22958 Transcript_18070/m.22958 type:complete len:97 (-) Transcript_18070:477-767(-)
MCRSRESTTDVNVSPRRAEDTIFADDMGQVGSTRTSASFMGSPPSGPKVSISDWLAQHRLAVSIALVCTFLTLIWKGFICVPALLSTMMGYAIEPA